MTSKIKIKQINKKQTQLEEEIKDNKKKKEELNSELEQLEKELESSKAISKEKKTNENFLNNYDYDQKELQNDINKFEKKIKPLEQQCEHLTKEIERYQNDRPSNNQQFDSSKKLHEIKDNLDSPKISKNNTFNFTISSPDKDTINQKFFPSKENFFGTKFSPLNTNQRSFSPKAHSPILNYYIGLSPPSYEYNNYYSPKIKMKMKMKVKVKIIIILIIMKMKILILKKQ